MSDKGLQQLDFTNNQGNKRGFHVSTLRERIKASLWTIGVEDAKQLVASWKKAYPSDKFGREAARKWLNADAEPQFMKPETAIKLGALTGFDPNWIQSGTGDPRGSKTLTPKEREMLEIFAQLRPARQDRLIEAALDSLTTQSTMEPNADIETAPEPVKRKKITT